MRGDFPASRGAPARSVALNDPFRTMGFSLKETIQLLGYPHDYGNPHVLKYVEMHNSMSRQKD